MAACKVCINKHQEKSNQSLTERDSHYKMQILFSIVVLYKEWWEDDELRI